MVAIHVDGLTKHYRVKVREPGLGGAVRALFRPRYRAVRAVEGVSFRVAAGEIVGFLGPNGAGKTTTIKMLTGLLYPTAGRAQVVGFDPWKGGASFKHRFTLVLGNKQQLIWDLPPEETWLLNRVIYGIGWPEYRRTIDELVALLGLEDVLGKPVRQLSQGERMKCELAASLLHRPELLFLDEPTLGLDLTAQETIRAFIREYSQRHGATVLLTSHYMADVTALAPRVLIINHGQLLYDGELRRLSEQLAPVKRLELVLGDGVAAHDLARFGQVREFSHPRAVLEVPRKQAARISARLLTSLAVLDVSIHDPPIEEVIRRAFAGASVESTPESTPEHAATPTHQAPVSITAEAERDWWASLAAAERAETVAGD
ncbi:MAG: ATP-binding cassette domain-containing protein [Gemmatimonadetes bacterium]|nr:ATP-binding cassette domain-containing protein [Gemmatimonadota bacterium]